MHIHKINRNNTATHVSNTQVASSSKNRMSSNLLNPMSVECRVICPSHYLAEGFSTINPTNFT